MQALRIGVVGAGHFGRFHALKLAKFDVLAGVSDAQPQRAALVADECGVAVLDQNRLIELCDAVVVATPTAQHFSVAEAVLRAGRHVFIEKPIAATLAQADALIALAEPHGLVLQVGHIERYSAAILTLRREMGGFAPRALEATRVAPFRPRSLDISVVLDLMIHDIDLVLSLVDAPLAGVRAVGARVASDLPDYVVAQLTFENGAQAQITASRVAVSMERRLRLLGDAGEIRVDFLARELRALRPGGAAPDENMPGWGRDEASWTEHDSLEAELRAFIASIQHAAPVEANAAVARAALATALRIEAALGVSYDPRFMALAIAQSARALSEPGLEPFGAVVVRGGQVIGQGANHSRKRFDPTSHGETEAIRDACARLRCTALPGATLYSSCEPCALCVAAMHIVGIETVYFAGSLEGSNAILALVPEDIRARGDVAALRVEAGRPIGQGAIQAEAHPSPEAEAILRAWAARHR